MNSSLPTDRKSSLWFWRKTEFDSKNCQLTLSISFTSGSINSIQSENDATSTSQWRYGRSSWYFVNKRNERAPNAAARKIDTEYHFSRDELFALALSLPLSFSFALPPPQVDFLCVSFSFHLISSENSSCCRSQSEFQTADWTANVCVCSCVCS